MVKVICSDRVMVESNLPIRSLLKLEINHQLNDHGKLYFQVMIQNEEQETFLKKNYQEEPVIIYDLSKDPPRLLFCGKIKGVSYKMENEVLLADIHVISYTIDLGTAKKNRSFQNPDVTFQQVVNQITESSYANCLWKVDNRKTGRPFIQYQESDWRFLARLASHLNRPLQASFTSNQPDFYFGVRNGKKQVLNEANILEFGFDGDRYLNVGYAARHSREEYRYLKVRHLMSWEIGDYVHFGGRQFTVYERNIRFEDGELLFFDTLGTRGMLYYPTIYNQAFRGLQLQGTIADVEHESVYIQFNFDVEESADFPWEWVSEVGNHCYIMPEIGSRVVLSLTSADESEAIATHIMRRNGTYPSENHRGFSTIHDKQLGLYSDQILLHGKDNEVAISMIDERGINFNAIKGVELNAQGDITFRGEQIFVQAPQRILMQTSESNIEMCKNFNIYAPQGVSNNGTDEGGIEAEVLKNEVEITAEEAQKQQKSFKVKKKEDPAHWQVSFAALGSISSTNMNALSDDTIIRLYTLGSVSKLCGGHVIASMSEVMAGKSVEETSFPEAITNMKAYTFNGGFYIPIEERNGD